MSSFVKNFSSKMLVLSEKDVRRCLSMADCLAINRQALLSISDAAASQVGGKGTVPTRIGLPGPPPPTSPSSSSSSSSVVAADDWTLFKPAAFYADLTDDDATNVAATSSLMGMKIVSIRARNPEKGLPLVPATIMVLDADSGIVQAILNGTYLTGARTAASSGLATKLAKPDMESLVVFGAGLQAQCHIEAIQTAIGREIPKITIVNRSRPRAEDLKEKISCGSCEIILLDDAAAVEKALSTADVVAATTNTTTPLFDGSILPPGCHINGIGSYTPEMQEIPANAVNRSRILIDTPDARNVGDLKHLAATTGSSHPITLLGDALANPDSWIGSKEPDYTFDCTFYKGVGTAIQDVMTADLVVKRAREMGIGMEVDMS